MGSNHMNDTFDEMSQLKKHMQYKEDPLLFINEHWFGMSSEGWQYKKITPFKYQESIIEEINILPMTFIASSRQMGITNLMCAYIAWYTIFNQDKTILIISHNSDGAQRTLKNIKTILESYIIKGVFDFEEDCLINNKKEIGLSNGCKIKAKGASVDACKGEGIDFLFIDQAAFMKDFENLWMAVGITLSCNKNSKAVIASTPNDNSYFNKMCIDICNKYSDESEYPNRMPHLLRLTWDMHPKRDKAWYDNQCLMMNHNQKLIGEELDCIINYKDKSTNDKTISLRITGDLHRKVQIKIGNDSLSDYIRGLIEKDLELN
jgi:hypothetical protein